MALLVIYIMISSYPAHPRRITVNYEHIEYHITRIDYTVCIDGYHINYFGQIEMEAHFERLPRRNHKY